MKWVRGMMKVIYEQGYFDWSANGFRPHKAEDKRSNFVAFDFYFLQALLPPIEECILRAIYMSNLNIKTQRSAIQLKAIGF